MLRLASLTVVACALSACASNPASVSRGADCPLAGAWTLDMEQTAETVRQAPSLGGADNPFGRPGSEGDSFAVTNMLQGYEMLADSEWTLDCERQTLREPGEEPGQFEVISESPYSWSPNRDGTLEVTQLRPDGEEASYSVRFVSDSCFAMVREYVDHSAIWCRHDSD